MIDTIVLRIHNITEYKQLYEQFYKPNKKGITQAYVNEDTGEYIENTFFPSAIFHDSNRCIPITHRSDINIASSHYTLSYWINTARNYLEFNFSIPKYLYTTNVFQFINMYDQSAYVQFLELQKFIVEFVKHTFIQEPLFEDIEINRIDFCYNQFFNNKEEALAYLNEQKKLLSTYARSSRHKVRTYNDESWVYITRRYSFKVYHKGTEFYKHDAKEIYKNGNKKKLDLSFLQHQADNVLRYEMTMRSSYLNYLVQYQFFKKDTNEDILLHSHPISKFLKRLQFYGANHIENKKEKKKTILDELSTKSRIFTLKSHFDLTTDLETLVNSNLYTFDQTIFQLCYNNFWEMCKKFQLETAVNFNEVSERLAVLNADNEIKNYFRSDKQKEGKKTPARLLFPAMLAQYTDIGQLKQYIPDKTWKDLMRDLKKLGITLKSSTLAQVKPRLDYEDYKIYFSRLH